MSDEQRLHRGTRAREVLENEEFQSTFARIEEELTESWKNIPSTNLPEHVAARERIHLSLTMLGKVKSCIVETMETGKLAAEELKYHKTLAERAKAYLGLDS